jgi:pimeloyl-ACP methyl ester carboxylesterase
VRNFLFWICLVSICGCGVHASARAEEPYGKMIRTSGGDLHVDFRGEKGPLVLFFSDVDMYSARIQWGGIQDMSEGNYRTLSYDRLGYYWSDSGKRPRTGEQISYELESLLDQEGWDGPYILVGHGMGALFSRIFAGRNIDDIRGIIWLDPLKTDALDRMAEAGLEKKLPNKKLRPLIRLMIFLRLTGRNIEQYGIPDDLYETAVRFYDKNSLTWFDEMSCARETLEQASWYSDFGDIPLTILTSGKGQRYPELSALWIQLQTELLPLSSRSSQIILADTGHYIHLEKPELLLDELDKMARMPIN